MSNVLIFKHISLLLPCETNGLRAGAEQTRILCSKEPLKRRVMHLCPPSISREARALAELLRLRQQGVGGEKRERRTTGGKRLLQRRNIQSRSPPPPLDPSHMLSPPQILVQPSSSPADPECIADGRTSYRPRLREKS